MFGSAATDRPTTQKQLAEGSPIFNDGKAATAAALHCSPPNPTSVADGLCHTQRVANRHEQATCAFF
jgi:hypothetical protein